MLNTSKSTRPPSGLRTQAIAFSLAWGLDAGLPVFAVRYAADYSWYKATPLNAKAKEWLAEQTEMIEEVSIDLLYKIRGQSDAA